MSSLFLRIYLSALGFLVVIFFITLYIANSLIPNNEFFDNAQVLEQRISEYLSKDDLEEVKKQLEMLNAAQSEYHISLINNDDLSPAEQQRLKVSADGRIKSDDKLISPFTVYSPPGSKWLLKFQEPSLSKFTINEWLDITLPLLLIFLTIAFALYLLIRKLTQPINHLSEVAQQLGEGKLKVRANSNLPKPMNTLASGFNTMAERLDKMIQEQQVMIGAIPHELRTPLGRIRFALDMTRNKQSVADLRQQIEKIDDYVDDMQETVDTILQLNRLQNSDTIDKQDFDLCTLLESLLAPLKNNHPQLDCQLDCQLENHVDGNQNLIKHAISNLLENAARHTRSSIRIRAWQEKQQTIVRVDDDGEGIPPDQHSRVFSPFLRLDKSRNRQSGGLGLGLALVNIIMKKHQGNATASSNPSGGARFELRW
jgi:signal transduction histidine kinase